MFHMKPRNKVIRWGQRKSHHKLQGITGAEVQLLKNFWELEEQLGIRKRPEDTFLEHIPKVTLNKKSEAASG
jgi:hypothetical protein